VKLKIRREQDKGWLGGISFVVNLKVELTPQEEELIQKYKAGGTIIAQPGEANVVTIDMLVRGLSEKCKDVGIMLAYEDSIKNACKSFKLTMDVMSSFGGEEIIEY
jgi:hypothetical protein